MRGLRWLAPSMLWLLSCLCLFSGGCYSFHSVSVAASFGQLVGARASAASSFASFCEAENILAGATPTCPLADVLRYTQEITTYSQKLSAYATAVRNIADFNDPRPPDALGLMLVGMGHAGLIASPVDPSGQQMASAAGKIVAIVAQNYRRGQLEKMVEAAHPHVVAVVDGLLARVTLLREPIADLVDKGLAARRMMLAEVDKEPKPDPVGRLVRQAGRIGFLHFELAARRNYEALVEYEKALRAFKRAHEILFEFSQRHLDGLADNGAIYELLKKDLPLLFK